MIDTEYSMNCRFLPWAPGWMFTVFSKIENTRRADRKWERGREKKMSSIIRNLSCLSVNPPRKVSSGNMNIRESRERESWEFLFCFNGSSLYSEFCFSECRSRSLSISVWEC